MKRDERTLPSRDEWAKIVEAVEQAKDGNLEPLLAIVSADNPERAKAAAARIRGES